MSNPILMPFEWRKARSRPKQPPAVKALAQHAPHNYQVVGVYRVSEELYADRLTLHAATPKHAQLLGARRIRKLTGRTRYLRFEVQGIPPTFCSLDLETGFYVDEHDLPF